ncbi:sulfatase-like hydrolase/transferase [Variovorax sp. OV329]|uniref:sulfatase-like hydrolase/transferase n=1 Tax=Variovorax sp. OV329 TaxID=1882825 RepID=UPI0008E1F5FD|nr:sulfatase-like hydrolase/transferase [Variovorax sp. OV329]SFN03895.1 Phosphoglycerol transferase MdoB [Variovorax sp. OV329]
MKGRAGIAGQAALALLVLNALLTLRNGWPAPWPELVAGVSLELVLVLSALALWIGWRGQAPGARGLRWLAGASVFAIAAHYLDSTAAALLGRPLNLYWDAPHAMSVLRISGIGAWRVGLALLGIVLVLVLLYAVVRASWGRLGRALASSGGLRAGVLLASGLLLCVFAVHDLVGRDTRFLFAQPTTPALARQVELLVAARLPGGAALTASPEFARHSLAGLHRADVLLLFAESYGACTLDDPDQARALAPDREQLLRQIQASGRDVVTARVVSPTFGGSSWLAHAALLAGVDTHDPGDYERLLASDRPSLVQHFKQQGWRTVNWMPGLQKPWPEGGFWDFDRYADAGSIGYQGLAWGHWRIPDQAALAQLQAQELAGSPQQRQPRFTVMATLASHMPFVPLPPLLPDLAHAADPAAYTPQQLEAARRVPGTSRNYSGTPAYLASLRYTFQWLGSYLAKEAPQDLVTVLLGDHQPWAVVSGSDASWEVPVHIISRDRALLDRLVARGFVPGLVPPQPQVPRAMYELTAVLLDAFDAPLAPAAE